MLCSWALRILAVLSVFITCSMTAGAATMDYLGAWSSTTTYATGKVVKYNGGIFYSLKSTSSAPNKNKPPSENPTWWEPVGSAVTPTAVYDATGKFVGPLISGDVYGNNAFVGFSAGGLLVSVGVNQWGFLPCTDSAAVCVPSAANDFVGFKVYATTDCSGPAYYWSGIMDRNYLRTYGSPYTTVYNSPTALSFDIYYPTTETRRTISSYYAGNDGCKRMNHGNFMPTPSADLIVNDGTFAKVSVSGFTAPFYIK